MQVFYGTNFWGHPKDKVPLEKIEVNTEYVWDTVSGFIPAMYVGKEGIVIDFCTRISNEAVQVFYDKWKPRLGDHLSEEEQQQLMAENPLNFDFTVKVAVNGKLLENDFACGSSYSKVIAKDHKTGPAELKLVQEYGCDEEFAWYFKRHQCKWEEMPERIESLDITFIAENKEVMGEAFEVSVEDTKKQSAVVHPVTGKSYTLNVCGITHQEIPQEVFDGMRKRKDGEWPRHYLMLSYCMEPTLTPDSFRLKSVGNGDSLQTAHQKGASVVSVIGSVDGPTSVFIAGKTSRTGEMIAMSEVRTEPVKSACFKPVFMEKEREDMELHIELG